MWRPAVAWATRTLTGHLSLAGAAGYAVATVSGAGPARWILLAGGLTASGIRNRRLLFGTIATGHDNEIGADTAASSDSRAEELAEARTALKFGVAGTLEQLAFARGVRHVRVEMRGAKPGEPVCVEGVAELTFTADSMTTFEVSGGGDDIDEYVEGNVDVTVTVKLEAHPDEDAQQIIDVARHAHEHDQEVVVVLATTVHGELEWLSIECSDGAAARLERRLGGQTDIVK